MIKIIALNKNDDVGESLYSSYVVMCICYKCYKPLAKQVHPCKMPMHAFQWEAAMLLSLFNVIYMNIVISFPDHYKFLNFVPSVVNV